MHGVTNPWIGDIGGRVVAGSCGGPIVDIIKVTKSDEVGPLDWMERTLTWRHYAPTGPNTLPVHPFFKNDPFVMTECPDIYFAANMSTYESKLVEGTHFLIYRPITEFSADSPYYSECVQVTKGKR